MMYSEYLLDKIRDAKKAFTIDYASYNAVRNNLLFVYHACIASERLLMDAANEKPSDQLGWKLSSYYRRHFEEEKGEIGILKEDLEQAKIHIGEPDIHSMAMIGTQYYLIKHVHPVALLGYMAVQEADPNPLWAVEKLEERYGKNLFRFIRMHVIKDVEHAKEIIELLDELTEPLQDIVSRSTENVLMHYREAVKAWQYV